MLSLFAALTIGIVTMPSFATIEFTSPMKQWNNGTPLNEILCNRDKVLMQSPSGKPNCISLETSLKLETRGYSLVELSQKISEDMFDANIKSSMTNKTINLTDEISLNAKNPDDLKSYSLENNTSHYSGGTPRPNAENIIVSHSFSTDTIVIGEPFTLTYNFSWIDYDSNGEIIILNDVVPERSFFLGGANIPSGFDYVSPTNVDRDKSRPDKLSYPHGERDALRFYHDYDDTAKHSSQIILTMTEPYEIRS